MHISCVRAVFYSHPGLFTVVEFWVVRKLPRLENYTKKRVIFWGFEVSNFSIQQTGGSNGNTPRRFVSSGESSRISPQFVCLFYRQSTAAIPIPDSSDLDYPAIVSGSCVVYPSFRVAPFT